MDSQTRASLERSIDRLRKRFPADRVTTVSSPQVLRPATRTGALADLTKAVMPAPTNNGLPEVIDRPDEAVTTLCTARPARCTSRGARAAEDSQFVPESCRGLIARALGHDLGD